VNRIRIDRPRIRRERASLDVLPADPRDPDVAQAKAFAPSPGNTLDGRWSRLAWCSLVDQAMPDTWPAGRKPRRGRHIRPPR